MRRVLVMGMLAGAVSTACGGVPTVARPSPFPGAPSFPSPAEPRTEPVVPAMTAPRAAGPMTAVLDSALALRGIAYRLGGEDPAGGFDCSGLVRYVFTQHALDVPRTVVEQYAATDAIAPDDVRAGDLLFFSTIAPGPTHVGIALGPLSQGQFIHAPGTGGSVRVDRVDTPYWRARWIGARRVR